MSTDSSIPKKDSILVVDDNPHNLKVISSVLGGNYSLTIANSASKALQILSKMSPDLILLDIMMPDMDGYEVCKLIKEDSSICDIPIIFLTAKNDIEDLVKGFDYGAVDYITKPFNIKEVHVRVENHLKLARARNIILEQNYELEKNREELEKRNEDLSSAYSTIEEQAFQTNQMNEKLLESEFELKKINLQLHENISEKDKFFSIIAHDLKSPFNGFLGLTQILADDIESLTMKEMQEFSHSLQESAKNLYELLGNLLEWSLMQRGKTEFNPEKRLLSLLVKHNIEIQKEVAQRKNITIINNIDKESRVLADLSMLNTVFRNLLSNSIKFTPRGGTIEIGIKRNSDTDICFYIKDSGIGMAKEMIDKLFKIDEKISRPGTEDEPSSGLGLLLCHEFIQKHCGSIYAESEVGVGTTFYITLPKAE